MAQRCQAGKDNLSQHLASKPLGKALSSCAWLPLDPSCGQAADSMGGCCILWAPFHFNTCLIRRNVHTCRARSLHKSSRRPRAFAPFVTERGLFLRTTMLPFFFFFSSPLSPSSSPSCICIQPLEGPTSCHDTCVGGFLCEQRIQNIAFLYIMKSHILLCSYKTKTFYLRHFNDLQMFGIDERKLFFLGHLAVIFFDRHHYFN